MLEELEWDQKHFSHLGSFPDHNGPGQGYVGTMWATVLARWYAYNSIVPGMTDDLHIIREETTSGGRSVGMEVP